MGRKGAKVGAFPWCSALQLTLQLTGEQHWGHVGDVSGWTASHRLKMGHPGETRWVCGASPCRWSHVCHMCHMLCLTVHSEGVNEISRNTILGEGTYILAPTHVESTYKQISQPEIEMLADPCPQFQVECSLARLCKMACTLAASDLGHVMLGKVCNV